MPAEVRRWVRTRKSFHLRSLFFFLAALSALIAGAGYALAALIGLIPLTADRSGSIPTDLAVAIITLLLLKLLFPILGGAFVAIWLARDKSRNSAHLPETILMIVAAFLGGLPAAYYTGDDSLFVSFCGIAGGALLTGVIIFFGLCLRFRASGTD